MTKHPSIAIIGKNSLMIEGLRQMLEEVMPFAAFQTFSSTAEMLNNTAADYFHYFVSISDFIADRQFYSTHKHQTIVLIDSKPTPPDSVLPPLTPCIDMLQQREKLLRCLLQLQQKGHRHYANYPTEIRQAAAKDEAKLTPREKDVLTLLAQGMINKEIADTLHISVNTAITHRKHIMQKLRSQSLSKLAIYAVQHGYVSPDEIL